MEETKYCITLEDVRKAATRINGVAHKTPVLTCTSINRLATGDGTVDDGDQAIRRLFFKVEALQRSGSFKFRGALNAIKAVLEDSQQTGTSSSRLHVVTHSSGNHAGAVALAAKLASSDSVQVTSTIVMPRNAPQVKRMAVEDFGAEIVTVDNTNEAREDAADEIVERTGACFIHPSEDPRVIAGQGTACLELVDQLKNNELLQSQLQPQKKLDLVIIPVGGGGLASGNTVALRGLLGDTVKIVLAEPAKLDDAKRSFTAKKLMGHHPDNAKLESIADGLKTTLGPNTWPIVRDLVDDIITVSEKEILAATKLIWERLKICIEPSAGVGVAVALSQEFRQKYDLATIQNVGIILCGGNVDVVKIANLIAEL